jgi:hypothetical protein
VLIDELLVVGDNGLGDGLTDGVDLRCVSTTSHSDADIDVGELLETDDEEGFVDLKSEDLRLDEVERLSVHLDQSFSGLLCLSSVFHHLHFRRGNWSFEAAAGQDKDRGALYPAVCYRSSSLLLAEALNTLC